MLNALIEVMRMVRRQWYRRTWCAVFYCSICERPIRAFLPYRKGRKGLPALIRSLHVIGSDVDHFECPACGCHDRERHLLMYLQSSGIMEKVAGAQILHLAPEPNVQCLIENKKPAQYVLGDLCPNDSRIVAVDLQALPFPNEYFDILLANHVLEHVENDLQALAEIARVLKPGGYAVLQTPYSPDLRDTFCDAGISNDMARLQAYGQEDHRRLYGRTIFQRFESSGLISQVQTHDELLPNTDPIRFGVNRSEPFFLFRKPLTR